MFLTQLHIDPRRRLAQKYLGSPQVMHAVVMRAAGTARDTGPGRVLWRVDQGPYGTTLYLLTPAAPDCAQLVADAAPVDAEPRTLDYEPFLARLEAGQEWAFRLAANPSWSVSRGQGVRGQRVGHVTVEQQREWLTKRTSGYGFDLLTTPGIEDGDVDASVLVVRRERPVFGRRRPGSERRDRVTINRTVYEGVLRVIDAEVLRATLVSGIGRSKAYGCGLLTLARPGIS